MTLQNENLDDLNDADDPDPSVYLYTNSMSKLRSSDHQIEVMILLLQEKRLEPLCSPRLRRNVYTLSTRPRRAVPSMLRQESRVKLRRDSCLSGDSRTAADKHKVDTL